MKIEIELNDEQHGGLARRAKVAGLDSVDALIKQLVDRELEAMDSEEEEIASQLESLGYM